jgi:hypothetical protein
VNNLPNAGWLNAHFVNDGMEPNVPAPDVTKCDANGNPFELPGGGSLYYSPFNGPYITIHDKVFGKDFPYPEFDPSPATITLDDSQWNADCKDPANAIPRPDQYPTDQRLEPVSVIDVVHFDRR